LENNWTSRSRTDTEKKKSFNSKQREQKRQKPRGLQKARERVATVKTAEERNQTQKTGGS
jgi:hypothetical protein